MKFKFNGQFFKSRNFIVFTLVLMLVLVGTINYNLSKKSYLETSNELKEYEKSMMENYNEDVDKEVVKTSKENKKQEDNSKAVANKNAHVKVVDSNKNEVEEKVKATSANITKEMISKKNMQKNTYAVDMKMNREKQRGELLDELNELIKNPSSTEKSKDAALDLKLDLIKFKESEMKIENLLIAKGFENPVVYLSKTDANVVVDKEKLEKQDIAKIVDVVNTEAKIPFENIKIMQSKR